MSIPTMMIPLYNLLTGGGSDEPEVETPSEEDFTALGNNLLSALQGDVDYSYLFDDVTDLTPNMPNTGIGSFDVSNLFGDDDYDNYSYIFDDDYSYTPGLNFDAQRVIDNMFNTDDYASTSSGIEDLLSTIQSGELEPDTGPLGGTLGPTLKKYFLGSEDDPGFLEELILGKASSGSGGGGGGGNRTGGVAGLLTGGDGGLLSSPLLKLILANYLSKRDE